MSKLQYVLRLADTSLILAQRLGQWIGHSPALEEDLGLANTALDLLGQARLLLTYAGELEGLGRDGDAMAFLRSDAEFRNVQLAEQPNGDFGNTMVRQLLIDAFQLELHERLVHSSDTRLAEMAAQMLKETRYHFRYSSAWVTRLGDGTEESHARSQSALDRLWPFTRELFDPDDVDTEMCAAGVGPNLQEVRRGWSGRIAAVLAGATLQQPEDTPFAWYGKRGQHSEHLGYVLAELQYMQRMYPGANW